MIAAEVEAGQQRHYRAHVDAVRAVSIREGRLAFPVRQPRPEHEQLCHGTQGRQCPEDDDVAERRTQQQRIDQRRNGYANDLPVRIIGLEELQEPTDETGITAMEIGIPYSSGFLVMQMMLRQQCCIGQAGVERQAGRADRAVQSWSIRCQRTVH